VYLNPSLETRRILKKENRHNFFKKLRCNYIDTFLVVLKVSLYILL
jgi:hypothetical protein